MPNCKVGDICVIKGSNVPANNGLIVEVVRGLTHTETAQGYVKLDPSKNIRTLVMHPHSWVIKTVSAKLRWESMAGRVVYADVGVCADYKLFPLRDNPDQVTTDVWANDYHLQA